MNSGLHACREISLLMEPSPQLQGCFVLLHTSKVKQPCDVPSREKTVDPLLLSTGWIKHERFPVLKSVRFPRHLIRRKWQVLTPAQPYLHLTEPWVVMWPAVFNTEELGKLRGRSERSLAQPCASYWSLLWSLRSGNTTSPLCVLHNTSSLSRPVWDDLQSLVVSPWIVFPNRTVCRGAGDKRF